MSLNVSKHLPDGHTLSCPRRWEVRLGPCRASAAVDLARSLPGGRASPLPGVKPPPWGKTPPVSEGQVWPQTPLCCDHSCRLRVYTHKPRIKLSNPPQTGVPILWTQRGPSPPPQDRSAKSSQQGLGALAPSAGSLACSSSWGPLEFVGGILMRKRDLARLWRGSVTWPPSPRAPCRIRPHDGPP